MGASVGKCSEELSDQHLSQNGPDGKGVMLRRATEKLNNPVANAKEQRTQAITHTTITRTVIEETCIDTTTKRVLQGTYRYEMVTTSQRLYVSTK